VWGGDMRSVNSQCFLFFGLAVILGIALVTATQCCTLEALGAHAASPDHSHQQEATDHHGNSPSPGKSQEVLCCFALQAIDTATSVSIRLGTLNPRILRPLAFCTPRIDTSFELTRIANGLSPPAREPTLHRPFYHTTFANHAPPLYPS